MWIAVGIGIVACVMIATASIAAVAFFVAAQSLHEAGPVVIFPIIVGLLIGAGVCYLLTRGYVADFKALVIDRIVRFIDENLTLSTGLMARITDFKRKTGEKIHLSFIGSMVFVAVSYTRSLFEPRLFKTLLGFEPVRQYFEDLQLAVGIVDDLNLNTRIWSKE